MKNLWQFHMNGHIIEWLWIEGCVKITKLSINRATFTSDTFKSVEEHAVWYHWLFLSSSIHKLLHSLNFRLQIQYFQCNSLFFLVLTNTLSKLVLHFPPVMFSILQPDEYPLINQDLVRFLVLSNSILLFLSCYYFHSVFCDQAKVYGDFIWTKIVSISWIFRPMAPG